MALVTLKKKKTFNKSGAWGEHTHPTIYKRDYQQGPTV